MSNLSQKKFNHHMREARKMVYKVCEAENREITNISHIIRRKKWIAVKDQSPPVNKHLLFLDDYNCDFTGFYDGKKYESTYGFDCRDRVKYWAELTDG